MTAVRTVTQVELPDAIRSLAADEIAALRILHDMNVDQAVLSRWLIQNSEYNHATHPVPVQVVGPTLNLARRNEDPNYYSRAVAKVAAELGEDELWRRLRTEVLLRIENWFQGESVPLPTPWGPAYWGVLRTINRGAPPHWDDLNAEWASSKWRMPRLKFQYAVNIFLRFSGSGGQLQLWLKEKVPSSDGPFVEMERPPSISVQPTQGQIVIFKPGFVHSVEAIDGERTTLSFFVGIREDDKISLWS